MGTILFEKVKNSIQPNDCEYNIFDEDKNLIANAVIFDINDNTLDIAELKPYLSIKCLIAKLIDFAKLNKQRCLLFPRFVRRNNYYYCDESIGEGSNIYDIHGKKDESYEDDLSLIEKTTHGMNYIIYDHISQCYHIEEVIVNTFSAKVMNDNGIIIDQQDNEGRIIKFETVMPMLVLRDIYKVKNPLQIRIEILDSHMKESAKTIFTTNTTGSLHNYDTIWTKKELKKYYPRCFEMNGNILKDQELERKDVYLQENNQKNFEIQSCCLILEKSVLLRIPKSFNDIFMNIFINGINISTNLSWGFRLNKWKMYSINDIEYIDPTYGYEPFYKNDIKFALFTKVEFHKGFRYNKTYEYLTNFAIEERIPSLKKQYSPDCKIHPHIEVIENIDKIENSSNNNSILLESRKDYNSYIYLIREREFISSHSNIYKIGRTTQEKSLKIKRFNAYKKGSEIILLKKVCNDQVILIENKLKNIFASTFKRHADGIEYFEGDCNEMSLIIEKECFNFLQMSAKIS